MLEMSELENLVAGRSTGALHFQNRQKSGEYEVMGIISVHLFELYG